MPDPIRTVELPMFRRTLTLEPNKMFANHHYAVMEQQEDLKYFVKFFQTETEAHEYLDRIETEAKTCQEITTE
jgi:hypothetical protein